MRKFEISRINPYSVVNDLLNNILSIILAAIIAFVGCFVFLTYLLPKEYTSKMLVSVNLSGYTSQSTSLSLARTVSIAEKLDDVM
jgi:capsular polysaccharide biosynthesis protein